MRFKIKTHCCPIENKSYASSFVHPVVLFLAHKKDKYQMFPTFAIVDFGRSRVLFIASYSAENESLLSKNKHFCDDNSISVVPDNGFFQPHSAINYIAGESFYAFMYGNSECKYFYLVNYKENYMQIVSAGEFAKKYSANKILSFGNTFAKDPFEKGSFYITAKALMRSGGIDKYSIKYFKASLNLNRITEIFSRDCSADDVCPHATRRHKDWLLSSEFEKDEFQLLKTSQRFNTVHALFDYVSEDARKKTEVLPAWLETCDSRDNKSIESSKRGIQLYGDDFVLFCQNSDDYRFKLAPGDIRVLSLEKSQENVCQIEHSKPGHFEIGKNGDIYLSCHNMFSMNGKNYFIGPAAIVKLKIEKGIINVVGKFQHPKGFRFTSHAVFNRNGKECLCTFGYPNRLFLIDGESMNLIGAGDMGQSCLLAADEIDYLVGEPEFEHNAVKALSVSEDGQFILFINKGNVCIASLSSLSIIDTVLIVPMLSKFAGWNESDIVNDTFHCSVLA